MNLLIGEYGICKLLIPPTFRASEHKNPYVKINSPCLAFK